MSTHEMSFDSRTWPFLDATCLYATKVRSGRHGRFSRAGVFLGARCIYDMTCNDIVSMCSRNDVSFYPITHASGHDKVAIDVESTRTLFLAVVVSVILGQNIRHGWEALLCVVEHIEILIKTRKGPWRHALVFAHTADDS